MGDRRKEREKDKITDEDRDRESCSDTYAVRRRNSTMALRRSQSVSHQNVSPIKNPSGER